MNYYKKSVAAAIILISVSCTSTNYVYKKPAQLEDNIKTGFLKEALLDSILITKMTNDILNDEFVNVHSVLISRDDKLVYEKYFNGYQISDKHEMRSAAKSLGSALVGIAIDKGYIKSVNQRLLNFFNFYPIINNYDKRKDKITIKHMLTMTTGIECGKIMENMNSCGAQMYNHPDPVKYILDLPMKNEPGEVFDYNDGVPTVLMAMVGISSNMSAGDFQKKYLYGPLEIEDDPETLGITPRAMMKFGSMYLNKGVWNGRRILSEEWVNESTKITYEFDNPLIDGYGYFWWIRTFEVNGKNYKSFYAAGNGGQFIYVFPELKMVIVLTGGNYNDYGIRNSFEIRIQPFRIVSEYILPALLDKRDLQ